MVALRQPDPTPMTAQRIAYLLEVDRDTANVYAAAPALLDAVRLTFRVLQNMTTEEFGRGADSEAREALRTAIAKATGEAVPA